jgi:hypothetical protein
MQERSDLSVRRARGSGVVKNGAKTNNEAPQRNCGGDRGTLPGIGRWWSNSDLKIIARASVQRPVDWIRPQSVLSGGIRLFGLQFCCGRLFILIPLFSNSLHLEEGEKTCLFVGTVYTSQPGLRRPSDVWRKNRNGTMQKWMPDFIFHITDYQPFTTTPIRRHDENPSPREG